MLAEEEPLVSDEESGCCSEEAESDSDGGGAAWGAWRPPASERLELAASGAAVAASSSALVVALPLVAAPAAAGGDASCPLLLATVAAVLLLWPLAMIARLRRRRPWPPLAAVARPGSLQAAAAAGLVAALHADRVLCHLQVPLMGSGLAFAVAFYFLVCNKVVSLKRIFSGMVVLLGVFISVDYQLCNEFRCRGREVPAAQLRGTFWTWGGHLAWAAAYVMAIGLWVLACALLENHFVRTQARTSPLLVSTVERLAATRELQPPPVPLKPPVAAEGRRFRDSLDAAAALSAAQLATIGLFAAASALAHSQKGTPVSEWWRNLCSCLWQEVSCGWGSWTVSGSYAVLLVSTCHLLALTESALFTMAAAAVALPVSGAWWSLFAVDDARDVRLRPSLTGDLLCAVLGLPVMLAALNMLAKAHWLERRRLKLKT